MRPHAELIEKHLEEGRWYYRLSPDGEWVIASNLPFSSDTEYKFEPRYCETRKALVRDWLNGAEYQYLSGGLWWPAACEELLQLALCFLRKKPNIVKLRSRMAVMKSTTQDGRPFLMQALRSEQEAAIQRQTHFIRWMGPWQETEVEI